MLKEFSSILILAILISCLSTNILLAQGQEKNYVQKISGTEKNINMVFIKEGTFMMGSDQKDWGHKSNEAPAHQVRISPFWMSEVEITWDLYNLFVSRDLDAAENSIKKGDEVKIEYDKNNVIQSIDM